MATKKIDELVVEIRADMKQLQGQLNQIDKNLTASGKNGQKAFVPLLGTFKGMLKPLAGIGVGLAAFKATSFVFQTGMAFEDLKSSLDAVFGSTQKAQKAFDDILVFSETTPFQVETVTKAFIALKSAGIEPNIKQLQTFANVASVTVDQVGTFEALVRMLQRSVAGGSLQLEELNMISDRGVDVFGALRRRLGLARKEVSQFGATAQGAAKIIEVLTEELEANFGNAMQGKMDDLSVKISNLIISFKKLSNEVFTLGLDSLAKDFVDKVSLYTTIFAVAIKDFKRAIGMDVGDFVGPPAPPAPPPPEATKLTTEQADFLSVMSSLVKDSIPELQQLNKQLELTKSLRGAIDAEGNLLFTDEEITRVTGHINTLIDDLDDVTSTLSEELSTAIQASSLAFTQEFVDALMNGQDALQTFKDFSKTIVSQIIATFLQLAVVNKILNSIFGAGTFDTFTMGKGITKASAGGGSAYRNQAMLVGERGPEIFVPHTAGTVMNNMNTKNAMGGAPIIVNQSVNFATGVVPTVRAEVTKMMPQIADVTKGAVAEAAMRGGNYRRMLQGG